MGGSFLFLLFANVVAQAVVVKRLSALATDGLLNALHPEEVHRWHNLVHRVTIVALYAGYETIEPDRLPFWATTAVGLSGLISALVFVAERKQRTWLLSAAVVIYLGVPIGMNTFIYQDMIGIIMASFVYVMLFFALRGTWRFCPHLEAPGEPPGRFIFLKTTLQVYQRYVSIALGVLGFTAATFLFGAGRMIESVLPHTDPVDQRIYGAVNMPYLLSLIAMTILGATTFAVGVFRDLHNKVFDTLRLIAAHPQEQKQVERR